MYSRPLFGVAIFLNNIGEMGDTVMKIRMSYLRMTAIAVLAAGLVGCGGGGGGDGGPAIPTASNAAITPPPTTSVAIATGAQTTNTTIAAAAFQAVNGAGLQTIGNIPSLAGVAVTPTATETRRLMIAEIVRRHAEKIKDYMGSAPVAGAQIVQTVPCFSGTETLVVDDMNGNFSQIFVNCDEGGVIFHGTISSTGVSATVNLGSTVGSSYNISVTATITIDLSITTASPAAVLVSQGSFTFSVTSSGTMQDDGFGGLRPVGVTTIVIAGPSLLASDGVSREQLSNFALTVVDDDVTGATTINSGSQFTYANSASAISGAVTVNITTPIHYASLALDPDAGVIEITTTASLGKIKVTFSSSTTTPVTVDVYANAADASPTNTYTLTWVQFDALI